MTDTDPQPVELEIAGFLDPELTAELDHWLSGGDDGVPDPPGDQADVDRLCVAIAVQRRKREQLKDVCRTRVDDIQAFYNLRDGQLAAEEERLTRIVEQWALAYAADTGTRTVTLPHGKVAVTRRRARLILDETVPLPIREASLGAIPDGVTAERVVKFHRAVIKGGTEIGDVVDVSERPDLAEQIPDGYELRHVTLPDPDTGEIVALAGAYALTALDGWQGDTATVTT